MASRFYYQTVTTPDISPAADAAWEDVAQIVRRTLPLVSTDTNAGNTFTFTGDGNAANKDCIKMQLISAPIAAQTISAQTFSCVLEGKENATANNMSLAVGVRILSNDGTVVRGTALAVTRHATEFTTTQARWFLSATTTEVIASANDRIVIEVGAGGDPGGGGEHAFVLTTMSGYGTDKTGSDGTSETTTDVWFNFANTISFSGADTPLSLPSVAVGVAALAKNNGWARTLASTAVGVAAFSKLNGWARTLASTAVGVAALSKVTARLRTLASTAVGVAGFSKVANFPRALAATAVGVASVVVQLGHALFLGSVAVGVAGFTRVAGFVRTLASTSMGVANMTFSLALHVAANIVAIGVSGFNRLAAFLRSFPITAIGVAAETKVASFFQNFSATAIGVASLATQYGVMQAFAMTAIGLVTAVGVPNFFVGPASSFIRFGASMYRRMRKGR